MSLIEFRDVTFVHQNGVTALKDVSLTVERDETGRRSWGRTARERPPW